MVKSIEYSEDINPIKDYPLLIRASYVALKNLNGRANLDMLQEEVARLLSLTSEQVNKKYHESHPLSIFSYYCLNARMFLIRYGAIEEIEENVFSITPRFKGKVIYEEEANLIYETRGYGKVKDEEEISEEFKAKLISKLQHVKWRDFEILTKDILLANGFIDVKLTSADHDGGIDGYASLNIIGGKKIPAVYQCKKYYGKTEVSRDEIDKFIGAKKDSGAIMIFTTTNTYSKEALIRAGEENIITIDKDELINILIDSKIGCLIKDNHYEINEDYFSHLNEKDEED